MKSYKAVTIANWFIKKGIENKNPLTPLQIIKLTYLAHGWNYKFNDFDLIEDEVQAWQYGPVYPTVYHKLKLYGRSSVNLLIKSTDNEIDDKIKVFLDKVYNKFSYFSGSDLNNLTHEKNSPWDQIYNDLVMELPIPNKIIKEYFRNSISN